MSPRHDPPSARSTALLLAAASASQERLLSAYHQAPRPGYRFYSFGDVMLIV